MEHLKTQYFRQTEKVIKIPLTGTPVYYHCVLDMKETHGDPLAVQIGFEYIKYERNWKAFPVERRLSV